MPKFKAQKKFCITIHNEDDFEYLINEKGDIICAST